LRNNDDDVAGRRRQFRHSSGRLLLSAVVVASGAACINDALSSSLAIPEEMIHRGMTKTAQLAIARGLAAQAKGAGVTVNLVMPRHPIRKHRRFRQERVAGSHSDAGAEHLSSKRCDRFPSSAASSRRMKSARLVAFLASSLAAATTVPRRTEGGTIPTIALGRSTTFRAAAFSG